MLLFEERVGGVDDGGVFGEVAGGRTRSCKARAAERDCSNQHPRACYARVTAPSLREAARTVPNRVSAAAHMAVIRERLRPATTTTNTSPLAPPTRTNERTNERSNASTPTCQPTASNQSTNNTCSTTSINNTRSTTSINTNKAAAPCHIPPTPTSARQFFPPHQLTGLAANRTTEHVSPNPSKPARRFRSSTIWHHDPPADSSSHLANSQPPHSSQP